MWWPSPAEPPTKPTIHPTTSPPAWPWVVNVLAFDDKPRQATHHDWKVRGSENRVTDCRTHAVPNTHHILHQVVHIHSIAMSLTDHLCLWTISTRAPTQSNHPTLMSSSVAEWPCLPTNSESMTTRVLVRSPPTTRCHDIPFIPTVLLLQRRNACTHCVPLTFSFDLFTHHAFQSLSELRPACDHKEQSYISAVEPYMST